jgi:hypothetical protein
MVQIIYFDHNSTPMGLNLPQQFVAALQLKDGVSLKI